MPVKYQIGIEVEYPIFPEKQEKLKSLFVDEEWEAFWDACQRLRFETAYELN